MPAAFVQSAGAIQQASAASVAATLGATVTAGSLVCGFVAYGSGTVSDLQNVTDDKSNTYTIQRQLANSSNSFASFYLANVTNGPVTLTANVSPNAGRLAIIVFEVSGVATSSALDVETGQVQVAPGTGADAVTSGAVVTTAAGDYILGGTLDSNSDRNPPEFSAGTGFGHLLEPGAGVSVRAAGEDQVQTSAGSIAATFTMVDPDNVITMILAFKAAVASAAAVTGFAAPVFRSRMREW